MTFRKFRKKYRILKIGVVRVDSTIKTEIYNEGRALGVCLDLKTKQEFEFELFCKISLDEINGEWKNGDKGQVKIFCLYEG
jgi:hypothetical protein